MIRIPLIDFRLLAIYTILFITAIVYEYIWQRLNNKASRTSSLLDNSFLRAVHIPVYVLLSLYAFVETVPYIPSWVLEGFNLTVESFDTVFPVGVTVLILWVFNFTLTHIQNHIISVEKNDSMPNAAALVSACKFGRVISIVIFLLVLMYHLKMPIGQLLAPTAIGAFGLSLAAKDILSNIFGGLMIIMDRPFAVGDFVQIANNEEGTVRYIGWRYTQIQLRNGRILHVPNGLITNSVVTNYSEKTHWFVQKEFGVRYKDFDKAPDVASSIAKWLEEHPSINHRRTSFANVFELTDSSVTIRIRAFLKSSLSTPEWYAFVEELLLEINRVVKKHKADFAFPTRTVIMEKD